MKEGEISFEKGQEEAGLRNRGAQASAHSHGHSHHNHYHDHDHSHEHTTSGRFPPKQSTPLPELEHTISFWGKEVRYKILLANIFRLDFAIFLFLTVIGIRGGFDFKSILTNWSFWYSVLAFFSYYCLRDSTNIKKTHLTIAKNTVYMRIVIYFFATLQTGFGVYMMFNYLNMITSGKITEEGLSPEEIESLPKRSFVIASFFLFCLVNLYVCYKLYIVVSKLLKAYEAAYPSKKKK
eukprot:TRINITY_DN6549_c0_g1_i5.p1 TRINITY_DN6549_c0_g1~~TRINITY_DN6549_c0_g1_i5.p1  ORF type:complete len:237 (-),score=22.63 TRINITY_DN6549_c0_g1_i5:112-822(-)